MKKTLVLLAAAAASVAVSNAAPASNFKVTEILYTSQFGEFIEVTNLSGASITDLQNYSFDDSSATPGKVPFPSVTLANNQAVIITEVSSTIFNQAWYTEPTTGTAPVTLPTFTAPVIIANNSQNLGRADAVNIFYTDPSTSAVTTVDQVTYDDQTSNGPRSEDVSAVPYSGWNYLLPNMTNVVSGVTLKDWVLSSGASVATKWKAGVSGTGAGGDAISGPVGSPGVAAFSSTRG